MEMLKDLLVTAEDTPQFNPAHSDQYAMFVWFCSNEAWRRRGFSIVARGSESGCHGHRLIPTQCIPLHTN